jgi:hypothetical protein
MDRHPLFLFFIAVVPIAPMASDVNTISVAPMPQRQRAGVLTVVISFLSYFYSNHRRLKHEIKFLPFFLLLLDLPRKGKLLLILFKRFKREYPNWIRSLLWE